MAEARQVVREGGFNFTSFHLKQGDALYVPPLWAHRTSTGEGLALENREKESAGVSISLNIFAGHAATWSRDLPGSKAEKVAEELNGLPLPFEASWPINVMQSAVALYLRAFLSEATGEL